MARVADQLLAGLRVVEVSALDAAALSAELIRIDALSGGLGHRRWPNPAR